MAKYSTILIDNNSNQCSQVHYKHHGSIDFCSLHSEEVEPVSKSIVRHLVDGVTNQEGQLMGILAGSWNTNCALEQEKGRGREGRGKERERMKGLEKKGTLIILHAGIFTPLQIPYFLEYFPC